MFSFQGAFKSLRDSMKLLLSKKLQSISFEYVALTLCGLPSHAVLLDIASHVAVRNPGDIATSGLASSDFARHYFRNLG